MPEPIKNRVQTALPVPLGFPLLAPGNDHSHENEWLNSLTFLPENLVQLAHPVSLAFPVIAPGSADSRESGVDTNVYHCVDGHANEFLSRETAKSLGVELIGELRSCTGCSMAKEYRKPVANISNISKSRVTKKLRRVFVLIRCLVRSA